MEWLAALFLAEEGWNTLEDSRGGPAGTESLASTSAGEMALDPGADFRRRVVLEHARSRSGDPSYAGEGLDMAMLFEAWQATCTLGMLSSPPKS